MRRSDQFLCLFCGVTDEWYNTELCNRPNEEHAENAQEEIDKIFWFQELARADEGNKESNYV